MKITVVAKPLDKMRTDVIAVICEQEGALCGAEAGAITSHVRNFLADVKAGRTKREWFCTLEKESGVAARHLLLESTTFGDWSPHDEPLKITAARCMDTCRQYSVTRIAIPVRHKLAAQKACAIAEGALLGDFSDTRFKSANDERKEIELTLVVDDVVLAEVRAAVNRVVEIAGAQNMARELTNAPNNFLTPEAMAAEARAIAKRHGMSITVLDEKQIQKRGYMPTWHVGRGSEYPPRIIIMRYTPKKVAMKSHVALVGKGMTFDSGGLCLKNADNMHKMNNDMGGAAAVLGTMDAIARLELPLRVTAIIGSAHNAVDGAAFYPGCIIKAKNGKTIYIENTDAEGRLVLSDCLYIAGEEKADVVWDYATLTGSVSAALGHSFAGLFTTDDALQSLLVEAGRNSGEELWPLPLAREYEPYLKHPLADLNNVASDKKAGATHAANFLKQFVPDNVRWAHMDIAGVVTNDKRFRYFRPGASGFGVRLTVEALRLLVEHDA